MPRESLVQQAIEQLFVRICDGRFAIDAPLPPQAALAVELEVSRLTVREAVETLRASNVVRVVHGSGSFVNPVEEWTDAEAITRYLDHAHGDVPAALQLMEVRRLIESGAAEACASRRTDAEVLALERHLRDMRDAHSMRDVDAFISADLAFHEQIIRGCRNPFMGVMYAPLMKALRRTRIKTSAVPIVREHAMGHHTIILQAIRAGEGPDAGRAMAAHIDQVSHDLCTHVLDCAGAADADRLETTPLGCVSRPSCLRVVRP